MSLVNYLVGNTRGRDHQYWPTILRDDLRVILAEELSITDTNDQNRFMDYGWPVEVSLAVLMQLAWRVREWRVEASSFTYSGLRGEAGFIWTIDGTLPELSVKTRRVKFPADLSPPDFGLREVTSEVDILGPASDKNLSFNAGQDKWQSLRNAGMVGEALPADVVLVGSQSGPGGTLPVFEPPFVEPGGSYAAGGLGQYVIFDPDTDLFYVPLGASGSFERLVDGGGINNTSGMRVEFYTLPVTPTSTPAETPQGTLTVVNPVIGGPDIVIPLGMSAHVAGSFPPVAWTGTGGSVTLMMRPIEWWPYGGKFDTLDGHKL